VARFQPAVVVVVAAHRAAVLQEAVAEAADSANSFPDLQITFVAFPQ
jgi:hypothetical protein